MTSFTVDHNNFESYHNAIQILQSTDSDQWVTLQNDKEGTQVEITNKKVRGAVNNLDALKAIQNRFGKTAGSALLKKIGSGNIGEAATVEGFENLYNKWKGGVP